jgi:hypothetical protein
MRRLRLDCGYGWLEACNDNAPFPLNKESLTLTSELFQRYVLRMQAAELPVLNSNRLEALVKVSHNEFVDL